MLVAGIDSSTQSCKVVVLNTDTGEVVRQGSAKHPEGTSIHPEFWWTALVEAISNAGGLSDVSSLSVGGQQHGMVLLDHNGEVVTDALLWNDTRSAEQAAQLVHSYGAKWWAEEIGSVPVASFTITKLAWIKAHNSDAYERAHAVCLPHDYLTFRLQGGSRLLEHLLGLEMALVTDRGDASGTGYWSTKHQKYNDELLTEVFGKTLITPEVLHPWESAGTVHPDIAKELGINPDCEIGAGSGDNMAAALGLDLAPGAGVISIGTSGTVFASTSTSVHDETGVIAGFADGTGHYLPLACTLNATQVLDRIRGLTNMTYDEFDSAALSVSSGADGLTLIPYLQGERTPNRPDATGTLHGVTLDNLSPAHLARAGVEAILCSLHDALTEIRNLGVTINSLSLIGGGAASKAIQEIAPMVFGEDVNVPAVGEYVALGMAKQAAKVIGEEVTQMESTNQVRIAPHHPHIFEQYLSVRG